MTDRTQIDRRTLVGLAEFRDSIFFYGRFEADEFFFLGTIVTYTYRRGVDKFYNSGALGRNLGTRVADKLTFEAGSHDRSFGAQKRYSLAHHVRAHQRTVGIIVLQERNQRSGDRSNLRRRYVHKRHFVGSDDREVGIQTSFYSGAHKCSVIIQRSITLCYNMAFFHFGGKILNTIFGEIDFSVHHFTIRSLDKS